MHPAISQAVILMAGSGSRLRSNGAVLPKPLLLINGRPLISYTLDIFIKAGIKRVYAVVGFEADALAARLRRLVPRGLEFHFITNCHWQKQNGISLLAVRHQVSGVFLLTMGDHLFDSTMVDLLIHRHTPNLLNVAVDRKIESIFDRDDAMKVETRGDQVIAIGKDLTKYNAIDTGLFICPVEIFAYLDRARQSGDCALADGVRLMAAHNKVRAIDIGAAVWQDVDTLEMLEHAEKEVRLAQPRRIV